MAESTGVPAPSKKVLGLPPKYVLPAAVGFGLAAILYYRYKKNKAAAAAAASGASTAAASGASTVTPTTTDQTAGIATDQYESLLALVRDLQGNISSEPVSVTGPPGPPGPAGTPASPPPPVPPSPPVTTPPPVQGPPAPAPPPVHRPMWHFVSVPGLGTYSLNDIARWNSTTPAAIIAETRKTEPSDVANYLAKNNMNLPLPRGTFWATPVFS
jgi:hypothetical protein